MCLCGREGGGGGGRDCCNIREKGVGTRFVRFSFREKFCGATGKFRYALHNFANPFRILFRKTGILVCFCIFAYLIVPVRIYCGVQGRRPSSMPHSPLPVFYTNCRYFGRFGFQFGILLAFYTIFIGICLEFEAQMP